MINCSEIIMEKDTVTNKDKEYKQISQLYDECLNYLKMVKNLDQISQQEIAFIKKDDLDLESPIYDTIKEIRDETSKLNGIKSDSFTYENTEQNYKVLNEIEPSRTEGVEETQTNNHRLRKLSQQLPKIIITQSNTSLNTVNYSSLKKNGDVPAVALRSEKYGKPKPGVRIPGTPPRHRPGYCDYPRRLVSKNGLENVALISNVPYERIRMLNDTFHTLINLRWRWIVSGTIVLHFTIWLVFAVFWYIAALAHYDFEPDPPKRSCVTGGKDFVTIFLASVEAQTTIGFGDRTIDEECPESIFLFIMQLILGTGLSGVLTCVVYAKLTRPEKLSRDGVGFSRKAVVSIRDGQLCLMMRAWDLNYDHIISSEFSAHFVKTHRTKEGEVIRYYARSLELQHRQFLLWPVTLVHVIDESSPLYAMEPEHFGSYSYEITVSLKGASASMGTFTQSQTSYLPKEIVWGYRFPSVVKYDNRKQKYVIDHKKLDLIETVETPLRSASQLFRTSSPKPYEDDQRDSFPVCPGTPGSFSDKVSSFHLERSSSFRRKNESKA